MVHSATATAAAAATPRPHPEVQKIIDTALPTNTLPLTTITPLPSSHSCNSTYALTLGARGGGGPTYILKLGPPPGHRPLRYEASILSAEAHLLQHLRATNPSLPTATLLTHDATCTLLDAPYILMSALPGTPLSVLRATLDGPTAAAAAAAIDRRVRALLHQLSCTPAPGGIFFGRAAPTAPRYATWRECFAALCEAVLRDGEEMQVLLPYEALRAAWARWAAVLEEVTVPRLAVLDFGDGSVLVDEGSGEVTGLVDFERAVWGDEILGGLFRGVVAGEEREEEPGRGWSSGERCRGLM